MFIFFLNYVRLKSQPDEAENQNRNFTSEEEKLITLNQDLLAEREVIVEDYKPIIDVEGEKQKNLGELELNKTRLQGGIRQIEFNHRQRFVLHDY